MKGDMELCCYEYISVEKANIFIQEGIMPKTLNYNFFSFFISAFF